jgi:hypothetical protein
VMLTCNRRLSTTAISCDEVWLLACGVLVGRDDAAAVEHGRLGSSEKLTMAATTLKTSIRVRVGILRRFCFYPPLQLCKRRLQHSTSMF